MNPLETLDNELRRVAGIFLELANSRQRIASLQMVPQQKLPQDIVQTVIEAIEPADDATVPAAVRTGRGGEYAKLRPIQAAFRFVRDHGEGHTVQYVQDECVKRGMRLKQERSFRTSLAMPDAHKIFKREKNGKAVLQGKLYFTDDARKMVERGEEA
ncbi:MAG TPA: hypothetical protein VNW97_16750 [Candidatus Saccharimonadales bacterium]|nr:hypothetical protein [Candidatus Saccharimonadales bacterium]